jgi:hypothetical protein
VAEHTQQTISVLAAPTVDFLAATTTAGTMTSTNTATTLLGAASNRVPSAGGGGNVAASGEQTLFPSLQATVTRNNSNNKNDNISRQNSAMQATAQNQMPVLGGGAGAVSRKGQHTNAPRSGRAAQGSVSSSSAAPADGSGVAGNRVRGKKKVTSEKVKCVIHCVCACGLGILHVSVYNGPVGKNCSSGAQANFHQDQQYFSQCRCQGRKHCH